VKTSLLLPFLFGFVFYAKSQKDSLWNQSPTKTLSGYVDSYYAFDFNRPNTLKRQNFLYNHNRHNQFAINLAYIKYAISHPKYRANIALHSGSYVHDNYAAEPTLLKLINEANVGVSLSKNNKTFLDFGVFPSYIGFESAISIDNLTLSRSILAENSPYFMTGAKLTYTPTKKIDLMIMLNNGWQRIQQVSGNSLLGFGSQVNYHPSEKFSFNWSSFIGTDDPDTNRRLRYFNNFYINACFKKFTYTLGLDLGIQQKTKNSDAYSTWFSPVIIVKRQIINKLSASIRAEYYHDQDNVIIQTFTTKGFKCASYSLNIDYKPLDNIALRVEARQLSSLKPIFEKGKEFTYQNFCLLTSIALKF
jgi:hypothetical protein